MKLINAYIRHRMIEKVYLSLRGAGFWTMKQEYNHQH